MAGSLEGVLAGIPGLAGYLASRQNSEQQRSQELQQAGALTSLVAHLRSQQEDAGLKADLAASGGDLQKAMQAAVQRGNLAGAAKLAPLLKQQQEAKLSEQFGGQNLGALSADQLDQLAARAAATNHPGAVGFAKLAEVKRTKEAEKSALGTMRSVPGQAAVAEQAPVTPVDDNGNPNPVVAGAPAVAGQAGVADFLKSSPFVGPAATSLQSMIDRGPAGLTPEAIQKHVDRLQAQHVAQSGLAERQAAAQQAAAERQTAGQANRIEIRNMFPPASAASAGAAPTLSGDAIGMAAARYRIDGTLPPNMGRGTQGTVNTTAVLDRAAAMAKAEGKDGDAERISQLANKSISTALSALERQRANVLTYEKTALGGADIAMEMSNKVARDTNVPVLDKWIQAGRKGLAGDVDVTRLHNAVETFTNEYAKVMSGSSGGQATTVSMQQHARELLSGAMTKDQFKGAIDLMKREMKETRETAFDAQINEMKARMRFGGATEAPKAAAPAVPATTSGGWKIEKVSP